MKNYEPSFANRLGAAAKAKQAQRDKARAIDPTNDPKFAERQAARQAQAAAREVRAAERKAARLAEQARKAEEQVAAEAARVAELAAEEQRKIDLAAEQKAARDAKYAARKARQK